MDIDPHDFNKNNFYDELSSFMSPPGELSLDDLDEILGSAQLDSSIPNFLPDFESTLAPCGQNDYSYSFSGFPSPATSNELGFTPPSASQHTPPPSSSMDDDIYFNPEQMMSFLNDDEAKPDALLTDPTTTDTPPNSKQFFTSMLTPQSTSSSSSSSPSSSSSSQSGDQPNGDEFMNFLREEDIKFEVLTQDTMMQIPRRNTPSPTGSCSSSCGSSTSGVQSDASSVESLQQCAMDQDVEAGMLSFPQQDQHSNATATTTQLATENLPAPLSIPVVQLQTVTTQPNLLQPITAQPVTVIPITTTNIKTPIPLKVIPKVVPKSMPIQQIPTVKLAQPKLAAPPNSKPKTIFLSSNDFKALMQKMNTNGGKPAKVIGANGAQLPKIVMKTANGKVITAGANNISIQQNKTHFVPKIVKAAGPMLIKQHPAKVTPMATAVAASRATLSSMPDINIYRGIMDEKMYKKQQRMMKNRESASLSRKKKKEYVVSLESRINNLEKENYTLKGENSSLRSQLVALAQNCQCSKHTNVSDFILNSLNAKASGSGQQHVKIAPKPTSRSMKHRMNAANIKKNVAVLFAMAFMVTLNVGNFQTYFNKQTLENAMEQAPEEAVAAGGRRLLWVETETEFKEKLQRSKRETELEVPPLHFLRPINRTKGVNGTEHQPPPLQAKCGRDFNQTENQRLASNLHKWIDGNDFLNLSLHKKIGNDLDNSLGFKLTRKYFDSKTFDLPLQGSLTPGKRKFFIGDAHYEKKKPKLHDDDGKYDDDNEKISAKNSLELFKPQIKDEYLRLFKGIKRQDDTFYVLSFNMDHVLLPASAYNKSSRPKMALMLPAGDPSLNGDIVLMQIDCEVVNTTELELKSHMIPEKLRPNKYRNVNLHANPNEVLTNDTNNGGQPKRPTKSEAQTDEKPPIRTYLMMGPKNQAAAAGARRKSNIIKLDGKESIVEDAVHVRNSSFFVKMRDAVEEEQH